MKIYTLRLLLLLATAVALCPALTSGQSGCPGCVVMLPDTLTEDTIYLSAAADGQVGVPYDSDLSFRMPKTTTPVAAVDPEVPPGITINSIEIISVSNLPPGLVWEANQAEFDLSEETDGCGKICGTPLQPGLYLVDVVVAAQVAIFSQITSFSFPITILPAQSITEGFTLQNNSGCGAVTVLFGNNIPSGGNPGFTYFWDLGNGQTTAAENPVPQIYSEPGLYVVNYEAIVDTTGYFLTGVTIESVECNDLFGNRPDLKIQVFDPGGTEIFLSDIIQNTATPLIFNLNLELEEGDYRIDVVDDDNGVDGADDLCGSVNFNRFSGPALSDNMSSLIIDIIHPVDTIRSVDTVFVFPQPDPPVIEIAFAAPLCEGDSAVLSTGYSEHIQWYRDSLPVPSDIAATLLVQDGGIYYAHYTSPDGCISTSEAVTVAFGENPAGVAYEVQNNLLTVFDSGNLPPFFVVNWLLNGELIAGAEDLTYCIDASGVYTLVIIDEETGCSASFSQELVYNPNFPNCVNGANDIPEAVATNLTVYPNPGDGHYWLKGTFKQATTAELMVKNSWGQTLAVIPVAEQIGAVNFPFDLTALPAGVYFIALKLATHQKNFSIIKQ